MALPDSAVLRLAVIALAVSTLAACSLMGQAVPSAVTGLAAPAGDAPGGNGATAGESGHATIVTGGDNTTVTITINGQPEPGQPEIVIDAADGAVSVDPPMEVEEDIPGVPVAPAEAPGAASNPVGPLMEHEGLVTDPYDLEGTLHVCYGHNLTASAGQAYERTLRECIDLLHDDMRAATHAAVDAVGEGAWLRLSPAQQGALSELAYLVGPTGIQGFTALLEALRAGDGLGAALELHRSLLHYQISADRLADMIRRIQR